MEQFTFQTKVTSLTLRYLWLSCIAMSVAYAQSSEGTSNLPNSPTQESINFCQRQLDSIQRKLSELTISIEQLNSKEQTTLKRLEIIQDRIYLTKSLLNQLNSQIARRTKEINQLTIDLASIEEKIRLQRHFLSVRLMNIYKYSRLSLIQAILTSRSLPEFYRRAINLRLISRNDRKLIQDLIVLNQQAEVRRNSLLVARADLERLFKETQEKRAALEKDLDIEMRLLNRIRNERESNQKIQEELQNAKEKLQSLIAELLKQHALSSSNNYLETNKGKLPWPVKGTLLSTFGSRTHPRYRTKTNNLGIDIRVTETPPVYSVAPGKVVYADRFIGYGNMVIIDHDNGYYTLYANLATLNTSLGAEVKQGTIIGFAEDYLHFEIRKDGQPLNPIEWLAPK